MQPFGVNPASVDSHRGYVEKMQFNFPLLSDPERTIAAAYNALKEDGKGIQRTVYGIGRAGAKLLLADVNAVGLADRVKEFAAEGIIAKASAGDLTQPDAARAAAAAAQAQFGGLDILVNVAGGFFSYGPFTEVTPEILDRELAVNFKTAFYMCQAAVPLLLKRRTGRA